MMKDVGELRPTGRVEHTSKIISCTTQALTAVADWRDEEKTNNFVVQFPIKKGCDLVRNSSRGGGDGRPRYRDGYWEAGQARNRSDWAENHRNIGELRLGSLRGVCLLSKPDCFTRFACIHLRRRYENPWRLWSSGSLGPENEKLTTEAAKLRVNDPAILAPFGIYVVKMADKAFSQALKSEVSAIQSPQPPSGSDSFSSKRKKSHRKAGRKKLGKMRHCRKSSRPLPVNAKRYWPSKRR